MSRSGRPGGGPTGWRSPGPDRGRNAAAAPASRPDAVSPWRVSRPEPELVYADTGCRAGPSVTSASPPGPPKLSGPGLRRAQADAASTGTVFTLLSMAPQDRDPALADAMYDAVMRTILTDAPALPEESTTAAAVTFRTLVPDLATLSDAERALLSEWLDRVSGS